GHNYNQNSGRSLNGRRESNFRPFCKAHSIADERSGGSGLRLQPDGAVRCVDARQEGVARPNLDNGGRQLWLFFVTPAAIILALSVENDLGCAKPQSRRVRTNE